MATRSNDSVSHKMMLPSFLVAADFDGDDDVDLAVTNQHDDEVTVLLNEGLAGFGTRLTYAVGNIPLALTAADLDGDGRIDLVTPNYHDDEITILLGNGDGSFADIGQLRVGHHPYAVTTADLDGDGYLDLAAANLGSDDVSILLNQMVSPLSGDCNLNGIPDECDIADGSSRDCNGNGTPDECEPDPVPCGNLDIKPGSCPNPFNRSSQGYLPVAIAGYPYFVEVAPNDVNGGASANADPQRTYNPGTALTLTAPTQADDRPFCAWRVNGIIQPAGQTTLQMTIIEGVSAQAVYTDTRTLRPTARPASARTHHRPLSGR